MWSEKPILHCKIEQPYNAEIWDGLLCEESYRKLLESFPSHLAKPFNYHGGLKTNLNRTHPELMDFFGKNKEWMDFYSSVVERFHQKHSDFKFEFSMLPNGGGLRPHTDTVRKATTAVFYFPHKDWERSYGGQFEIVRHKTNPYDDYSQTELLEWEDTEEIMSVPYKPNRCILMHRNGHSFHGVRQVKCPSHLVRQSVTVCWLK